MSEDQIGKELLGQFRIVEAIGRGGMGQVFKAEQPAMERMVAIKVLHAKLAGRQDLISRFRREARAMSRLTHPNTARVFLYGQLEDTGQLYIVMEYLEGTDLARLVRRDGPMEWKRAIKVIDQALGALEEAHSVGVIHRDLKPENILLTTQGGIPDFPKVLDFGLAKIRETKLRPGSMVLTQQGMVFGTPEFMSPEQARGEVLDARSDVYSMGLIFYELVTGKLPFPSSRPMEYIRHHINTPPILISARSAELGIPKKLDPIISRALEKNLNNRYGSAREFAEALKSLLPSPVIISQAPPPAQPRPQTRPEPQTEVQVRPGPQRRPKADPSTSIRLGQPGAHGDGSARPAAKSSQSYGKGIVAGLLVVIVVLLAVVIWLLVAGVGKEPVYDSFEHSADHSEGATSAQSL